MTDAAQTDAAQTDIGTLRKFVTLQPAPIDAKWSVSTIGSDAVPGPSDTALWAVLRYAEADFATVARALEDGETLPSVTVGAPPAWLLADVDLVQYRQEPNYVIAGPVSAGTPFASDLYTTGFALVLPDQRVLIRFSSQ